MINSEILIAKIRKRMNVLVDLGNTNHNLIAVCVKAIVPHWLISDLSKP